MAGVLVSRESTESRGTHAFCWTSGGGGAWSLALGTPRRRGTGPWAHHTGEALGLGCGAQGLPVPRGLLHLVRELLVVVSGLRCPGDLSSQTRDGTCVPCLARRILNHWTAREALD